MLDIKLGFLGGLFKIVRHGDTDLPISNKFDIHAKELVFLSARFGHFAKLFFNGMYDVVNYTWKFM